MYPYARTTLDGHTFDTKTKAAIEHAWYLLGGETPIYQGSYHSGYAKSGGTHDGGGAVDVDNGRFSWAEVEWAFRLAGFAAWHRTPDQGDWTEHVHAILIGNTEMSDAARKQVQDYYGHLDGLAYHRYDDHKRPHVIVPFQFPLGRVTLSNVVREARKTRGWVAAPGIRHIQRALNLKSGTHLVADGIYGPKTKAAYARWEVQQGGDGNGIPAPFALRLLGAARFKIVDLKE
jgi:hypothetical protein